VSLKHLPPEWRSHPVVMRAHIDHIEERVAALETADVSRPSKAATAPRLDPVTLRVLILSLCILTATGTLRPEQLLKFLPQILRIVLGG